MFYRGPFWCCCTRDLREPILGLPSSHSTRSRLDQTVLPAKHGQEEGVHRRTRRAPVCLSDPPEDPSSRPGRWVDQSSWDMTDMTDMTPQIRPTSLHKGELLGPRRNGKLMGDKVDVSKGTTPFPKQRGGVWNTTRMRVNLSIGKMSLSKR